MLVKILSILKRNLLPLVCMGLLLITLTLTATLTLNWHNWQPCIAVCYP